MDDDTHLGMVFSMLDFICAGIAQAHPWLPCKAGCSGCCTGEFKVSDAEGRRLADAMQRLPADARRKVAGRREGCPFLEENLCLVYGSRPLICRLYGYGELGSVGNRYGCGVTEGAVREHGGAGLVDVEGFYRGVAQPFTDLGRSISEWALWRP